MLDGPSDRPKVDNAACCVLVGGLGGALLVATGMGNTSRSFIPETLVGGPTMIGTLSTSREKQPLDQPACNLGPLSALQLNAT